MGKFFYILFFLSKGGFMSRIVYRRSGRNGVKKFRANQEYVCDFRRHKSPPTTVLIQYHFKNGERTPEVDALLSAKLGKNVRGTSAGTEKFRGNNIGIYGKLLQGLKTFGFNKVLVSFGTHPDFSGTRVLEFEVSRSTTDDSAMDILDPKLLRTIGQCAALQGIVTVSLLDVSQLQIVMKGIVPTSHMRAQVRVSSDRLVVQNVID